MTVDLQFQHAAYKQERNTTRAILGASDRFLELGRKLGVYTERYKLKEMSSAEVAWVEGTN